MLSPEDQLRELVRPSMERAGIDLVSIIQYDINEAFPPASEPYTPPHKRTGNLQELIRYQVDEFPTDITLSIISDATYSRYLNEGTDRMARRDFMGPEAIDRYTPAVISHLIGQFRPPTLGGTEADLARIFGIEFS